MAATNHFRVLSLRFLQTGKMLFRNDEHVRWRFRVDVLESKYMFVFEDFSRWNFSAENAAEEAVNTGVGHRCSPWRKDSIWTEVLSAPKWIPILGDEFDEGLRVHIPRAFEGIVEISQHKMGEEEQHGRDPYGYHAKSNVTEGKKEKQKQNHGRCQRREDGGQHLFRRVAPHSGGYGCGQQGNG